jgi:hypothetical protein
MATSYKILGQKKLTTGSTPVVLYYVPASTQAIISTITVCNTSTSAATYRIAVLDLTAAPVSPATIDTVPSFTNESYLVYDATVGPNETISYTLGLTVSAFDKVVVNSSSTSVSFNAYGSETV